MKVIKQTLVIIIFGWCDIVVAQSQSWDFFDEVVAGQKIAITGALVAEIILRDQQKGLFNRLGTLEKEYEKKRNAQVSALGSAKINAATSTALVITKLKIDELIKRVNILNKVYLRHGLQRYESELYLEKKYLERIQKDHIYQEGSIALSGGAGYNYTAFLKLLIRVIEIRANVMDIENKLDNLATLNRVLIKK